MKKTLIILLAMVSLSCYAQDCITDKGYIYSPGGFVEKEYEMRLEDWRGDISKVVSKGLYTADGKTLVKANTSNSAFYVAPGTQIIAKNALSRKKLDGTLSLTTFYIPNSVIYIDPDALEDIAVYIYDDSTSSIKERVVEESTEEATEVGRYNLSGIKLSDPTEGINIVKMSDGTSKKTLVK